MARAARAPGQRPGQAEAIEERPYEQARILGGGSSINGIGANRGSAQDYEEWEAGLMVSDASIMPIIACANLQIRVATIAEKTANGLRRRLWPNA